MFSIILPYRDRETHLSILLPRLHSIFHNKNYEIIIVEQDDDTKFKLAQLFNVGAQYANGSKLVFHDVDYYPSYDVDYEIDTEPVYPVQRVVFLAEDNETVRPMYDVPAGYRKFYESAEGHWGGVFILTKEMFEKIGGFNPIYVGWGAEDIDRHQRLLTVGYKPIRNTSGTFYALYHEDNCPPDIDEDFRRNNRTLMDFHKYLECGYKDQTQDVEEFDAGDHTRWLKVKNIQTAIQ